MTDSEQIKLLMEFVKRVSEIKSTGGDPGEECELCMGELQESARQVLEEVMSSDKPLPT